MTLTLREEVLKNSGLLTEEILEEGFLKKALIIATTIAMIAGVAIGGIKAGKSIKQYNSVKDVPVAVRYEKADTETNADIVNKEYYRGMDQSRDTAYSMNYKKLQYVDSVKSEYNERNHQAILNIYVDNSMFSNTDRTFGSSTLQREIQQALGDYVKHLEGFFSNIEGLANKIKGEDIFNVVPLKVIVHFSERTTKSDTNEGNVATGYTLSKAIKEVTGTDSVEYKYDYKSKY